MSHDLLRKLLLSLFPPLIGNPHKWFTLKPHSCQVMCQSPALQAVKKMPHPLVKQLLRKLLIIYRTPPLNTQSTPLTPHLNVNHSSRFPKLNLPTFSGSALNCYTLWDSFKAAVHSNTTLGVVQKFSYLRA